MKQFLQGYLSSFYRLNATQSEGSCMKERVTAFLPPISTSCNIDFKQVETIVKNSWLTKREADRATTLGHASLPSWSGLPHASSRKPDTTSIAHMKATVWQYRQSRFNTDTVLLLGPFPAPSPITFCTDLHPTQVRRTRLESWSLRSGTKPAAAALWLMTTWPDAKTWTQSMESIKVFTLNGSGGERDFGKAAAWREQSRICLTSICVCIGVIQHRWWQRSRRGNSLVFNQPHFQKRFYNISLFLYL